MSDAKAIVKCPSCKGEGWILNQPNIHDWHEDYSSKCLDCNGTGKVTPEMFTAITGRS